MYTVSMSSQLRSVSRSLPQDVSRHPVQSLILSRINYCNVAFGGLPQRSIIRFQAVINAAARMVLRVEKFDRISTAIQDELQWLKIGERINFKLCILMHKCINNCAPRLWNNLPGAIHATKTLSAFKNQLKLHLL